MKSHTFIFPTTEEFLSSSPGDLVIAIAASAAVLFRCAAAVVAESVGANGVAVMTASIAR